MPANLLTEALPWLPQSLTLPLPLLPWSILWPPLVALVLWRQSQQVHRPLLLAGKLAGLVLLATSTLGLPPSRLFFIMSRTSHLRFLADIGAQVSVISPSYCGSTYPYTGPSLQATNHSSIATHSVCPLCLNLELRRLFQWTFIVADMKHPILGANFLGHFNLLVGVNLRCLVDTLTQLQVHDILTQEPSPSPSIPLPDHSDDFIALLTKFPCLLCPLPPDQPVQNTVTHHIVTTGPSIASHSRRLLPEQLKITHQELDRMLALAIMRPFSSCWASLFTHGSQEKNGELATLWGLSGPEPHHRSRPVPPAGLYLFIVRATIFIEILQSVHSLI